MSAVPPVRPVLPVVSVYPSGRTVPPSLLRLSIRFARPVHREVVRFLTLQADGGPPLQHVFVPQELWSRDFQVLTVLLHPSRVKTGGGAYEALGPALVPGTGVTLHFDGVALHRWEVSDEPWPAPRVDRWSLRPGRPGTREPLHVAFDCVVDLHAEARLCVVDSAGEPVRGQAQLSEGERLWSFRPDDCWSSGSHSLRVHPCFENPCGDRVDQPLEHGVGEGATGRVVALAFQVGDGGGVGAST